MPKDLHIPEPCKSRLIFCYSPPVSLTSSAMHEPCPHPSSTSRPPPLIFLACKTILSPLAHEATPQLRLLKYATCHEAFCCLTRVTVCATARHHTHILSHYMERCSASCVDHLACRVSSCEYVVDAHRVFTRISCALGFACRKTMSVTGK